jgi:hypothetical protein
MIERLREAETEVLAPEAGRDLRGIVEAARAALEAGARAIVLDLARVAALRGDDIERLLEVRALCRERAAALVLAAVSREGWFAVDALDLAAHFPYRYASRAEALDTLRRAALSPPGEAPLEIGFDAE